MSTVTETADEDRALKARHRTMWALGDYPEVAQTVIPTLGSVLVDACGVRSGERVLDVAAGSGNVALPAAVTGAQVVASDLTPELFDEGRRLAGARGVEVEWREADAENLPFDDGEFDAVLSCVGVMFAPHHQAAADELVRVCRPGGTIGLISWTPGGFLGQMLATMRPYAPAPPPGAPPPPLWGDERHVTALLADRVLDVSTQRRTVSVDAFDRPEDFRDFFKRTYGPTIVTYRAIASDPERIDALDRELVDLALRNDTGHGSLVMEWEYLLLTARRRD